MLSSVDAFNFMSWEKLHFKVPKGVTILDGWNNDDMCPEGSGKSSIPNMICWAAFGKLPKDVNIDDVIKDGETSCGVTVNFDNSDAIVRRRKPSELYLIKAGVIVKGKDAKETQTLIEEYIGCNFETYCQSVYFAQNYDKKFLPSNQEEKGKILSSIQNLQVFDKARKETMDLHKLEETKVTKLKNEFQIQENNLKNYTSQKAMLTSFIQDKIQKHKTQVSMMNQQLNLLSGHVQDVESKLDSIIQKTSEISMDALANDELELNQAKTGLVTQLSDVTYKKSQVDSIRKNIQSKDTEGKNLANRYQTLEQKINALNPTDTHRVRALTANKAQVLNLELNSFRSNLIVKKQRLEDFIKTPTKVCPSCGTELKTLDLSHTQLELTQIQKEIKDIEVSAQLHADQIDTQIVAEIMSSSEQLFAMNGEATNILTQLQTISEYLDQNKVPLIDELLAQEAEFKGVISQIDAALKQTYYKKMEHSQLVTQWQSLNDQKNNYLQQYDHLENQITQLGSPDVSEDQSKLKLIDQELSNIQTKLQELTQLIQASNTYLEQLETLKNGFKEIKSYVFTNALNELNFRTNKYLNDLFEMEASIKFSNEDQKIECAITVDGKSRSLGLLSGGQNRRFNLAVDLALSDIVAYRKTSKLDLIIFDEYFKDLSEVSMEKSLELLKSRKSPVILIEHNSLFKNIVDNTFFVRLENGTSHESRQ